MPEVFQQITESIFKEKDKGKKQELKIQSQLYDYALLRL